jgi:acetyl-CoA C-acetyltransferase
MVESGSPAAEEALMPEAVIAAAVRTPIGAHGGALASVRPDDLGALVVAEAVHSAVAAPAS